ncbi:MAG: crossover junction endodeoxyribonuclease RuvC [Candidatus Pacebacteria bacterium]|jgi:crossover junction endodeoxyribonuclease RuvC|nr:crossover junction endodeoxyribonuclease RuvC [Candidatus Paceibacterota bacterium]MBT4652061.1 crossover junction endodeoxyribonuclease RuvC [Candidatus Paceibacterota bacterium]MBT6756083.1 crossover junction endodeoxyribonuclease RuvC [Candidatus Paceibacterota bacterium]MBT6921676.1 crossover junction endodeoxyribonuclease RuvC [Candidatus Paceibacterota bacterium]
MTDSPQKTNQRKKNAPLLGIDPGYDRLGWAVGTPVGNNWENLIYGCIETPKEMKLFDRYKILNIELKKIIKLYKPETAIIESLFFFKNQKTALKVSEARGVILSTCFSKNMKLFEFTPLQIKQAVTGYGRADKKAVEKMVRLQLKLGSQKIIDDAIDALAVMMTYQTQRKLLEL